MNNWPQKYDIAAVVLQEIERGETCNLYGLAKSVDTAKVADKLLEGIVLEAPKAAPVADADGWIKWNGGEMPVVETVYVDVIMRSGSAHKNQNPNFSWAHYGSGGDIVEYRISKP